MPEDSFGNIVQQTGSINQPFTDTGREWDGALPTGTGLYYYRARYYDPAMGRFISEDPIGFAGGINFYVYVDNNPINATDPFGLAPSFWDCFWKCVKEYYGLEALTGLSGLGATPLSKEWLQRLGLIRGGLGGGGSPFTNPISLIGHLTGGVRLGRGIAGTANLVRIVGRLNPYVFAGLLGLDAALIGKCVYDCLKDDKCN